MKKAFVLTQKNAIELNESKCYEWNRKQIESIPVFFSLLSVCFFKITKIECRNATSIQFNYAWNVQRFRICNLHHFTVFTLSPFDGNEKKPVNNKNRIIFIYMRICWFVILLLFTVYFFFCFVFCLIMKEYIKKIIYMNLRRFIEKQLVLLLVRFRLF